MEPRKSETTEKSSNSIYALRRWQMVNDQLRQRGIEDARLLEAMATVPREEFVAEEYRDGAYNDTPLPIGFGQTISQPYTVAFLVEMLQLTGEEKVLDIGTGSGYQAAVLSHLAREVHSIERIPELCSEARERLQRLGYSNVHVHLSNGTMGLPEHAPFDGIVVAASPEELPDPLREQVAEGGRIVIPLGPHPLAQKLFRFTRRQGKLYTEDLGAFRFVPLVGEYGWGCES